MNREKESKTLDNNEFRQKVLVCITPQSNSHRLINFGNEKAIELKGELHILHVEKGDNLLINKNFASILDKLFAYGSELGGMVHAICEQDVISAIYNFIKQEKITCVVLGERIDNENAYQKNILEELELMLPYVRIEMLTRE